VRILMINRWLGGAFTRWRGASRWSEQQTVAMVWVIKRIRERDSMAAFAKWQTFAAQKSWLQFTQDRVLKTRYTLYLSSAWEMWRFVEMRYRSICIEFTVL